MLYSIVPVPAAETVIEPLFVAQPVEGEAITLLYVGAEVTVTMMSSLIGQPEAVVAVT